MKSELEKDIEIKHKSMGNSLEVGDPIRYNAGSYSKYMPKAVRRKVEKKKPFGDKDINTVHSPIPEEIKYADGIMEALSSSQKKSIVLLSSHSKRRFAELEQEEKYYDNYLLQNGVVIGGPKIQEKLRHHKLRHIIPKAMNSASTKAEEFLIKPFEEQCMNIEVDVSPEINDAIMGLKLDFNDVDSQQDSTMYDVEYSLFREDYS